MVGRAASEKRYCVTFRIGRKWSILLFSISALAIFQLVRLPKSGLECLAVFSQKLTELSVGDFCFSSRQRLRRGSASRQSSVVTRHTAFTLLELLVVIGIIALLLVAVIPAVTSLSKSSGRKGAISNLLGAIEQARAEAIKTGQPSYIVFAAFTAAPPALLDRYHYKSYTIFVDDSAHPGTPKQVSNWKTLPTGISLRAEGDAKLSGLAQLATLTPPVMLVFTPAPGAGTENFRCIKFNATGEVESPPAPPNNIGLAVFEGRVEGATEVKTSATLITEGITIARLTGRAERSQ
jgi:prepilin-type N-terminal cleavage/methylation domain-containing protein